VPFLNQACANLLQHIAWPLEAAGLFLTAVEVLRPVIARRWEAAIAQYSQRPGDWIFDLIHKYIGGGVYGDKFTRWSALHGLILFGTAAWIGYTGIWWLGVLSVILLAFLLLFIEFVIILATSRLLHPFSGWTGGRALGGFGLLLGSVGLLMETYQVATIHAVWIGGVPDRLATLWTWMLNLWPASSQKLSP
jgi:hypothetical protein